MFKEDDKVIVLIDQYIESINKEYYNEQIREKIREEYRILQENNGGYLILNMKQKSDYNDTYYCQLTDNYKSEFKWTQEKFLMSYVEGKLPDNLFTF